MDVITNIDNQYKLKGIIETSFEKYHRLTGQKLTDTITLPLIEKEFSIEWFLNKIRVNKVNKKTIPYQEEIKNKLSQIIFEINEYNIEQINTDHKILILNSKIILEILYKILKKTLGILARIGLKKLILPIPEEDIINIDILNPDVILNLKYTFILQELLNHIKIAVNVNDNKIIEIKSIDILEDPSEEVHVEDALEETIKEFKEDESISEQRRTPKHKRLIDPEYKGSQLWGMLQEKLLKKGNSVNAEILNAMLKKERMAEGHAGKITRRRRKKL